MPLYVCSLLRDDDQEIPDDGRYHLVRFPFGGRESSDAWGMHNVVQPDGYRVVDWDADDRSALIWPTVRGWGWLTAVVYWEPATYREVRDRFARDPLGINRPPDGTATEDHAPTPGGQYRHKSHEIFVRPDVPLGFLVRHSGTGGPRKIRHAQFKLAVSSDVA